MSKIGETIGSLAPSCGDWALFGSGTTTSFSMSSSLLFSSGTGNSSVKVLLIAEWRFLTEIFDGDFAPSQIEERKL
ncbi:hypothetical protein C0J52_11891 [Blattella germanica]|nr:hypothetical protein C0J52_11891 [Blattella germanica]